MKKVTMIFVVSDGVADDALQEMRWGNMANAANILNENCEESDYDITDNDENKLYVLFGEDAVRAYSNYIDVPDETWEHEEEMKENIEEFRRAVEYSGGELKEFNSDEMTVIEAYKQGLCDSNGWGNYEFLSERGYLAIKDIFEEL